MYVTSISDDVQIFTFPWMTNHRDFQNSHFFYGQVIILHSKQHCFPFPDLLHLLHSFPELCAHSCPRELSLCDAHSDIWVCVLDKNACFPVLHSSKDMFHVLNVDFRISHCVFHISKFIQMQKYNFPIFLGFLLYARQNSFANYKLKCKFHVAPEIFIEFRTITRHKKVLKFLFRKNEKRALVVPCRGLVVK